MRIMKKISVLLAAIAVILVAVTGILTLIANHLVGILSPSLVGYSKKADKLLHPELTVAESGEVKEWASLNVRFVLGDNRIGIISPQTVPVVPFSAFVVDQSIMFLEDGQRSPLSSGIYSRAYRDDGSGYNMKNIFGLTELHSLYASPCGQSLLTAAKENPGARIRLDAYTMQDYIIVPMTLSFLDENDNVIQKISTGMGSGTVIEEENVYLYNDTDDIGLDFGSLMQTAALGVRSSDKIADTLADTVHFDENSRNDSKSYGIGSVTAKHIEVTDGYAMISVVRAEFQPMILLCVLPLLIVGMIIFFVILAITRKKKAGM